MQEKSGKFHYAWLILAAMVALQAGIIGIMVNCTGIIFSAVISDLGFRSGDLSIFYTIRALASAATVGITTKLFFEKNSKAVITVLAACMGISCVSMSLFSHLWQWYAAAVFAGVGMSCVLVVIPIVLNNWFKIKNGLVIGIAMSASGVAGAIYSPICSNLINSLGWRKASVITGVVGFLIVAIPTIFILKRTPEEKGVLPLGYDEAAASLQSGGKKAADKGYDMPSWVFALCMLSVIAGSIMTQLNNQLPTFAKSLGYTISVGAFISSLSMIGNIVGKLLMGVLADKMGIFRAVYLTLGTVSLSMLLFMLGGVSPVILYISALLYGLVFSMGTTVPSLVFFDVYGAAKYKKYLSRFQATNSVVMAFSSSLLPYIYDFTGSFKAVMLLGLAMCVVSVIFFTILKNKSEKLKAQLSV